MRLDLHLHTDRSDGRATPEALVWKAAARDLDLIAITDHDTTDGLDAARDEGRRVGVHVVPGVELSARLELPGEERPRSLHLIGLGFDVDDAPLAALLARIRASRERAAEETLERLGLAGWRAALPEGLGGARSIGRPHLARALVAAGHARDTREAFDRFLSGDAFRGRYDVPSAGDAIRAIHDAGGVAVYAHPRADEIDAALPILADLGLDGVEVFRPARASSPLSLYTEELAKRFGLLPSGGSDWHGFGPLGQLALGEGEVGRLAREIA